MNAERLIELESLFFRLLECPRAERAACLQHVCGEDMALREELRQLLDAHERAEQQPTSPAVEIVAQQLAQASVVLSVPEHYEVLQELGRGGMSQVLLARDKRLRRKVALKVLPPAFAADDERRRRFEQEARLVSALNHPNILTVYEIAAVNDTYFMATEYVEGETLRQRLSRAPLDETEAVNIALQIAAALEAAHTHGIIHRDIKPENIMLRPDGYVKVLDFGIAKITDPQVAGISISTIKIQTATGQIVGTPAYIAPEQLRGGKLDGRSDLFGLGVVLYEMLAGEKPFTGATLAEVLTAVLHKEAKLPAAAQVSSNLAAIVMKALRKAPEERFQSATEFSTALRQAHDFFTTEYALQPESLAAPVAPSSTLPGLRVSGRFGLSSGECSVVLPSTSRKLRFGIGLLVLAALIGVVGYQYRQAEPPLPPVNASSPSTGELLRYAVELSSPQSKSVLTDGTVPIPANTACKFHFTSQQYGYLYLVASGQQNVPQTVLTAQAVKGAKPVSNRLLAHHPYVFPAASDAGLSLNKTLTTFTVIFSTKPLHQPVFLTAPAGHELTVAEQEEFEVFKKQFDVQVVASLPKHTEAGNATPTPMVVISSPDAHRSLVIFDVMLRRK